VRPLECRDDLPRTHSRTLGHGQGLVINPFWPGRVASDTRIGRNSGP
jgi:hypothetical protein